MRNFLSVLLSLIIFNLFFPDYFIQAQWVKGKGPGGAVVNSFAAEGDNIFAAVYGGVYLSTNNGSSWKAVNHGLPEALSVLSLAVRGSTIFAGTYNEGIYYSSNNGADWSAVNTGLPIGETWVNGLAFSVDTIFAGIRYGGRIGVYYSTNNGTDWTNASTGLPDLGILRALAISNHRIFAATNSGLYRSINGGLSWQLLNNGIPDGWFKSLALQGDSVYAGTEYDGSGIYRSADAGAHFTLLTTGFEEDIVKALAASGNDVYAAIFPGTSGGAKGIFHSSDHGTSWHFASRGLIDKLANALIIQGPVVLAGTLTGGVFSSTNNGTDWKAANNGLNNSSASAMLLKGHILSTRTDGSILFAGTGAGVFTSEDNGASWKERNKGLDTFKVVQFAACSNKVYALTGSGVYRSSNDGISWTEKNSGLAGSVFNSIAVIDCHIFVGTDQGVFLSSDEGESWSAVNNGLDYMDVVLKVNTLARIGNILFAGTSGTTGGGGVFYSADYGANWTEANDGIALGTIRHVLSLAAAGKKLYVAFNYGGLHHPSIAFSADSAKSWTNINAGIPPETETNKLFALQNNIIAVTFDGTYVLNSDNTWRSADDSFPGELLSLVYDKKYVYAGTDGLGIWRRNISLIHTIPEAPQMSTMESLSAVEPPAEYSLFQNYPNPFNPVTVIRYALPFESTVSLTIFSALGETVREFGSLPGGPGYHEISFDAAGITSGVYLYLLEAKSSDGLKNFREVKKMLILK